MQENTHEPVVHNGRTICSCGDYNCASLDVIGSNIILGEE